jgi:two-component sensor histidine kinase
VLWHGQAGDMAGALIMVHDATEERLKKQELDVKTTMIQEVHHRVKNNLQAIAATLRMQSRRTRNAEALHVLQEAISRILSVAVIHEFLSREETQTINIRDVCQRIIKQNRDVLMAPGQQITFTLEGPAVYLPSQQATACALVVNELIHNALEHGFEGKRSGQLQVSLDDRGDKVYLEIWDDGTQLPADFDLDSSPSLGLQIVRSLAQFDLHGRFRLENRPEGVTATVEFPKVVVTQELA